MRTGVKRMVCVLTVLFLLVVGMAPAMAETLPASGDLFIVTAGVLNMRMGAGTDYEVIVKLVEGDAVSFISNSGNWWKVQLSNGTRGYVDKAYLRAVGDEEGLNDSETSYIVTASSLYVRFKPSLSGKIKDFLYEGDLVKVTEIEDDWAYVVSDEAEGWASYQYLQAVGSGAVPAARSSKSGGNDKSSDTGKSNDVSKKTSSSSVEIGETYTVLPLSLNVRRRPAVDSTRLDKLKTGKSVIVEDVDGDWAYVSYKVDGETRRGWVSGEFLGFN